MDCPSALRAITRGGYVQHRVFFADAAIAIAAGYRPCAVCLPAQYTAWKAGVAKHQGTRPRSTGSGGHTPEDRDPSTDQSTEDKESA